MRRGSLESLVVILLVLSSLASGEARAQLSQKEKVQLLEESKRSLESNIASIRRALTSGMSDADQAFEKRVTYRVPLQDGVQSPFANIVDGAMTINTPVGFGRALEMLTDAQVIGQLYNRPELFDRYVAYTCEREFENERRVKSGQAPLFIKAPYAFIGWRDADLDRFDKNASATALRGKVLTSALCWVIGHELAHHYLGHSRHRPATLAQSRENEAAADDQATKWMVQAHIMPIGAAIPLLYFYNIDSDSLAVESTRRHPADIKRLRGAFQEMLDAMPVFRADIEASGQSYSEQRRNLQVAIAQMDDEIRAGH